MFAVPPHGLSRCYCKRAHRLAGGSCLGGLPFREWLSRSWADVVDADDVLCRRCGPVVDELGAPAGCGCEVPDTERRRHALAGTGIDYAAADRCADPKRLAVYFSKHGGAGGGKESQHRVPQLWLDEPGAGPGRWWGYRGLERATAEAALSVEHYVQARRTLRRLSESQGLSRTARPARGAYVVVDLADGELVKCNRADRDTLVTSGLYVDAPRRRRNLTRRTRRLAAGGLAGGFLLVNDGPRVAEQLAWLGAGGGNGLCEALRSWDAHPVLGEGVDTGGCRASTVG